jgi:hypothetical protein
VERDGGTTGGLRAIALIGAGTLAAAAMALAERGCHAARATRGAPAVWVADRGAGAVFGLDADLFVTRRVELDPPAALAADGAGGWWALCARDGWAGGAFELEQRNAAGELLLRLPVSGPARLAADAGGGVLVLPEDAVTPWRRLGPDGRPRPLPPRRGAALLAMDGARLALAGPGGLVRSFEGERELARVELAGAVRALAPAGGPEPGWWAVLEREQARELRRLDAALAELWKAPWRGAEALLAPHPDGARVWRVDRGAGSLELLGRAGAERFRADPALEDALEARALAGGALLVLTPGALLRFDERARRRPGQGGFDLLSGLAVPAQPP